MGNLSSIFRKQRAPIAPEQKEARKPERKQSSPPAPRVVWHDARQPPPSSRPAPRQGEPAVSVKTRSVSQLPPTPDGKRDGKRTGRPNHSTDVARLSAQRVVKEPQTAVNLAVSSSHSTPGIERSQSLPVDFDDFARRLPGLAKNMRTAAKAAEPPAQRQSTSGSPASLDDLPQGKLNLSPDQAGAHARERAIALAAGSTKSQAAALMDEIQELASREGWGPAHLFEVGRQVGTIGAPKALADDSLERLLQGMFVRAATLSPPELGALMSGLRKSLGVDSAGQNSRFLTAIAHAEKCLTEDHVLALYCGFYVHAASPKAKAAGGLSKMLRGKQLALDPVQVCMTKGSKQDVQERQRLVRMVVEIPGVWERQTPAEREALLRYLPDLRVSDGKNS